MRMRRSSVRLPKPCVAPRSEVSGAGEVPGVKNLAVSSQRRRARRGETGAFGAGALASLQESRRSREVA
eukprot:5719324-Prymnesium_polylepis.1